MRCVNVKLTGAWGVQHIQPLNRGGTSRRVARPICICQVNILKAHTLRIGYGSDSELQLAENLSTLLKRLSGITLCEK